MKKLIKMTIAIVLVVSMAFVTFGGTFDSAIKEMYALKDFLNKMEMIVMTSTCKDALDCIEYNNSTGSYSGRYIVKLGEFPQDGVSDMAKQPIEWIVLEKAGGKALLISRYVLDYQPFINNKDMKYQSNNPNLGWETSDLRKWLNNEFYNTAFNSIDKGRIVPYSLTGDNVFILNEAEMNAYFVLDKRDWRWDQFGSKFEGNPWCATKYTNYAKAKRDSSQYWLRDIKIYDVTRETSKHYGDKYYSVGLVTGSHKSGKAKIISQYWAAEEKSGVRPCIWVTYDDSVKSDREQGLEDLAGGIGKTIIGSALDSAIPGAGLLLP